MALIVQKYGGTSVGTLDRIRNVAARMKRTRDEGNQVVAVVSAMSGVTDGLIKMAKELSENPCERELDVLLATGEQQSIALVTMALQEMGVDAASITGSQAGIRTTGSHTRGRILNMDPSLMRGFLDEGKTLVVAGFQGVTPDGMIHTLGRGGSDLTAIAVAAALKADVCQILTDVDGVYTCDPRVVSPMWMASIPAIHGSSKTPASFRRFPMTKCWKWPPPAPKSCNPAPSSSPRNSASSSKSAPHSTTTPAPSC